MNRSDVGLFISVGASGAIHVVAGIVLAIGSFVTDRCDDRNIRDLEKNSMSASLIVLPKADKALPDRASHVPRPSTSGSTATEVPDVEVPVRVSDLALHKEQPTPEAPDRSSERNRLMDALRREAMLDALSPEGPVDRMATDPNSDSDVALRTFGRGDPTDPEWARYIARVQQLFMARFRPLGSIAEANPGITAAILIRVDPSDGRIVVHSVATPSGVPAYDAAAVRAVEEVGTIPLPPERYRDLLEQGYLVNFVPP